MSHINRRHSEIVKILNTVFICLVILCILCMSIDMASASSSDNKGNSGRKSNDHNQQPKDRPTPNASPNPTDTATPTATTDTPTPSPTPAITATPTLTVTPRQEPEPIRTIDMSSIYGTPIPTLSGTNNNTTLLMPMPVNETANSTIMNSTNADSYNVTSDNESIVIPDTTSGQQGGPSGNLLALTIIAIPAILAALVVVVQFVRKTE